MQLPPLFEASLESHVNINLLIKILTALSSHNNVTGAANNGPATTSALSKLNLVFTPRGIYFQLISDTRICFQLIKIKREFFQKYTVDLNHISSTRLTSNHSKFGKCYSIGVTRLDGVSVFTLPELSKISIVLRQNEDEESLMLVFLAKYTTGLVKKLLMQEVTIMESNFSDLYELVSDIPRLDSTELNYFDFDSTNFEFIDTIPLSTLRQYDFEMGTNGKIVRLRAFQPVVENDVLKQVSTHAISFRARNLKNWQLISSIKDNKAEKEYFKWQMKLSFLKSCVLSFVKFLKCDFRVYFSEELNEVLFSFNHLGLVEFSTLLIGFNDQFNNILPVDSGDITLRQTNQGNENEEEDKEQDNNTNNIYGIDDFGYTPAPDSFPNTSAKETSKQQKGEPLPLFHQTQSNEDDEPTDEGSDVEPEHNTKKKEDEAEAEEAIVQWNETTKPPELSSTLTNEQIINNAKVKYIKDQERKRKLALELKEKEKLKKKQLIQSKTTDIDQTSQLGPTQGVNTVKGLFD